MADAPREYTGVLADEQRARGEALRVARDVLVTKTGPFGGSGAARPADLIRVAEFVLTGTDPERGSHDDPMPLQRL